MYIVSYVICDNPNNPNNPNNPMIFNTNVHTKPVFFEAVCVPEQKTSLNHATVYRKYNNNIVWNDKQFDGKLVNQFHGKLVNQFDGKLNQFDG